MLAKVSIRTPLRACRGKIRSRIKDLLDNGKITASLGQVGFVKSVDFIVFHNFMENPKAGLVFSRTTRLEFRYRL